MKSETGTLIAIVLSGVAILGVSTLARADAGACSVVKPEELSKLFGDTFSAPDQHVSPAGPLAGPSAMCTFKGQNFELRIDAPDARSATSEATSWDIRRKRDMAKKGSVDVPGLGDSAYLIPAQTRHGQTVLESHQGIHEYTFSLTPIGTPSDKNWGELLIATAKLFYSRLK